MGAPMNTDQGEAEELATEAQRAQSGEDCVSSSPLRALRASVVDPSSSVSIGAPSVAKPLPVPRTTSALSFRLATLADLPALDALQKKHSKALGYFPTK